MCETPRDLPPASQGLLNQRLRARSMIASGVPAGHCAGFRPSIIVTDVYNSSRISELRPDRRFDDRRGLVEPANVGRSEARIGRFGGRIGAGSGASRRSRAGKSQLTRGRRPAASGAGQRGPPDSAHQAARSFRVRGHLRPVPG